MDKGKRINELNEIIKKANRECDLGIITHDQLKKIARDVMYEYESISGDEICLDEFTDLDISEERFEKVEKELAKSELDLAKTKIDNWILKNRIPGVALLSSLN